MVFQQPAARDRYRKRMPLAEGPMAEIRERLKFTRFRRVGISGVRVEFSLCVLALNLKWAVGRDRAVFEPRAAIFVVYAAVRGAPGGDDLVGLHFLAMVTM